MSTACRRRLSSPVPASPLRVGLSTCISSLGMPIFTGSRTEQSSAIVSEHLTGSDRRRKKKSPLFLGQARVAPGVYLVRVGDDAALPGLAENLRQAHGPGITPLLSMVGEHTARTYARQLVGRRPQV